MEARTARIAMLLFLATEAMFFAGLISAYWVLRASVSPWPPVGQPRLPILATGINTLLLLVSGAAIWRAEERLRRGCHLCFVGWIGITGLLGLLFLSIQGYEWLRLLRFGLETTQNIYGGLFYIIVGTHGTHVAAALVVLLLVFFKGVAHRYTPSQHTDLTLCRMYWTFVVAVWPILYALVYF